MVLGVLSNPGVAVVYVGGHDVLVHNLWHHHKPLGQEVSLEAGELRASDMFCIDNHRHTSVCLLQTERT